VVTPFRHDTTDSGDHGRSTVARRSLRSLALCAPPWKNTPQVVKSIESDNRPCGRLSNHGGNNLSCDGGLWPHPKATVPPMHFERTTSHWDCPLA